MTDKHEFEGHTPKRCLKEWDRTWPLYPGHRCTDCGLYPHEHENAPSFHGLICQRDDLLAERDQLKRENERLSQELRAPSGEELIALCSEHRSTAVAGRPCRECVVEQQTRLIAELREAALPFRGARCDVDHRTNNEQLGRLRTALAASEPKS